MVEKAQQEPHYPWFFTDYTSPFATQFTLPLGGVEDCSA